MSGGTLVMAGGGDFFAFGSGAAANGTFNMSGNSVATVGNIFIGRTQGNGTMSANGGTIVVKASVAVGGSSSSDGGSFGYGTFGGNAVMTFMPPIRTSASARAPPRSEALVAASGT